MSDNQVSKEEVMDAVRELIKEVKSDKEKKELKQLLTQLKDGSVDVAKATTVLSLRGVEWTWSKTKPLISGGLNFIQSAWTEAKKKNTKNDDQKSTTGLSSTTGGIII